MRMLLMLGLTSLFSLALLGWTPSVPAEDALPDPYANRIARPSQDAIKAIKRIRVEGNLQVDLVAAEPRLANPIAFCIDEMGRFYVAETFRLNAGATDNRSHPKAWLYDDLASRKVADRIAMYKKHLGPKFARSETETDRVRLLVDTDGDGLLDKATVFADGFNHAEDGLGSGLLARHGKVWYTCIPDLWLLQDTKGTGRADVKKSLHTGFGIHVAFIGHDLHGLKMGPDGRLYFSIGDRGLYVVNKEGKVLAAQDSGSVLRCNPDGSELEIFATGLRNPQELAFDQFGNLFTCDNNADGGDQARWVYLVEGGETGWRLGYQSLPSLGPWNAEKLWHRAETNTATYLLPPLEHITNGPSGLTYFPGTGQLPDRYRNHFFLCDFRGNSGGSGIWSFAVKPRGASFEITDRHQFTWSILATDCDFGPDGAFYLSDWVEGWSMPNKGRIYKIHDPTLAKNNLIVEVKKLLAEGFDQRSEEELIKLLDHADMRVRQEAQFALADKGAVEPLAKVALQGNGLARLHAVWGLGQIGRKKEEAQEPLIKLLTDSNDTEVRAQALKVLGDLRARLPEKVLAIQLEDQSPRVRFFAAQAAGKMKAASYLPLVLTMLRDNADADPYLRHAGVMALTGIADKEALLKNAKDPSGAVRRAVLLAMRRLEMPQVASFLDDVDPTLVLEAARAINDVPIEAAFPQLATVLNRPAGAVKALPTSILGPLYQRASNAHFRLGKKENALALATFAGKSDAPEASRLEALKQLGDWTEPSGRDRVVGLWRPLPPRPGEDVQEILRTTLAGIMTGPDQVRAEGARLAAKFGIKEIGPVLHALVADKTRSAMVRVETLQALEKLKDSKLFELAEQALKDDEPRLRHEGRRLLLQKQKPAQAAQMLAEVAEKGALVERQGAFTLLADLQALEGDSVLALWLDRLLEKKAAPDIQLDILEAAGRRKTADLQSRLAKYESTRRQDDPLAAFRETLQGGDAERGKKIFYDRAAVSCLRCHKINGLGGEVGPELTGIGKKQNREYLLESLVDPNRQIAKGYDTVVLALTNGQVKVGILKHEVAKEVQLMTAEGQLITVPTSQIDERARGKSAMPDDMIKHLSRSDLRNLVEFLAGLQ